MKREEISREQISAMSDGELLESQVDGALKALREKTAQDTWDIYHQIGDVLRSEDMAVPLSSGFAARMAARLEAEPTIVAPVAYASKGSVQNLQQVERNVRSIKHWKMPGMAAAAAMAAIAFIATPQLIVALKGEGVASGHSMAVSPSMATVSGKAASTGIQQTAAVISPVPDGVVLRDPRIDDYLLAHQRFSPSVYSTAQYARSTTFAINSDK